MIIQFLWIMQTSCILFEPPLYNNPMMANNAYCEKWIYTGLNYAPTSYPTFDYFSILRKKMFLLLFDGPCLKTPPFKTLPFIQEARINRRNSKWYCRPHNGIQVYATKVHIIYVSPEDCVQQELSHTASSSCRFSGWIPPPCINSGSRMWPYVFQ